MSVADVLELILAVTLIAAAASGVIWLRGNPRERKLAVPIFIWLGFLAAFVVGVLVFDMRAVSLYINWYVLFLLIQANVFIALYFIVFRRGPMTVTEVLTGAGILLANALGFLSLYSQYHGARAISRKMTIEANRELYDLLQKQIDDLTHDVMQLRSDLDVQIRWNKLLCNQVIELHAVPVPMPLAATPRTATS